MSQPELIFKLDQAIAAGNTVLIRSIIGDLLLLALKKEAD